MNKNIFNAVKRFQSSMQKIVDKDNRCTSISISSPLFNNGEEIVIAKKKDAALKDIKERESGRRSR